MNLVSLDDDKCSSALLELLQTIRIVGCGRLCPLISTLCPLFPVHEDLAMVILLYYFSWSERVKDIHQSHSRTDPQSSPTKNRTIYRSVPKLFDASRLTKISSTISLFVCLSLETRKEPSSSCCRRLRPLRLNYPARLAPWLS